MSITPLPTPPQPTDTTAEFNTKAFAWVAALDTFVDETNATTTADYYLGPKAVEPTLDNTGNALREGAIYFNTASNVMKVYSDSTWLTAISPVSQLAEVVGVGSSPLSCNAPTVTFEYGTVGRETNGQMQVLNNAYNSASAEYRYLVSSLGSSRYDLAWGSHDWYISPTGTAGNVITYTLAMQLNGIGNLGIGKSPTCKIDVDGQIAGKYNTLLTPNEAAQDLANNHVSQVIIAVDTTLTTTVPTAGARASVVIKTSGTTSRSVTFGTGFKAVSSLSTGTSSGRTFVISFVSDGTNLIETGRTSAITY